MNRILYILAIVTALVTSAFAADVGSAKIEGLACEQSNGYLAATSEAPEAVKAIVQNVNAERKDHYAKIAAKNGIALAQVASLTAQKVTGSAPQYACPR